MMVATAQLGEITALVIAVGGVLTALWRLSVQVTRFNTEHKKLMEDLKQRTEGIQRAVPDPLKAAPPPNGSTP